jgi:hypothetical protein
VRPLIMLDQLPWHELNDTGELTLQCEDSFLRSVECDLRQQLYKFTHFRGDMVMPGAVCIPKSVQTVPTFRPAEETLATQADNDVVSHAYSDVIPDEEALERMAMPVVSVDEAADCKHLEIAPVFLTGFCQSDWSDPPGVLVSMPACGIRSPCCAARSGCSTI